MLAVQQSVCQSPESAYDDMVAGLPCFGQIPLTSAITKAVAAVTRDVGKAPSTAALEAASDAVSAIANCSSTSGTSELQAGAAQCRLPPLLLD